MNKQQLKSQSFLPQNQQNFNNFSFHKFKQFNHQITKTSQNAMKSSKVNIIVILQRNCAMVAICSHFQSDKYAQINKMQRCISKEYLKDQYIQEKEASSIGIQKQPMYSCMKEQQKQLILVLLNIRISKFLLYKMQQSQNFKDLDIGSPLYMSPQGMIDHIYGMKSDIWAFGVIIYELFHGQTPFYYCKTQYDLKRAVSLPINMNLFKPDLNPEIKDLIIKCLIINFEQRPDALTLRSDPYLNKLLNEENNINVNHMMMSVNNNGYYGRQVNNGALTSGQGYFGKKDNYYEPYQQQQYQQIKNNNYQYQIQNMYQPPVQMQPIEQKQINMVPAPLILQNDTQYLFQQPVAQSIPIQQQIPQFIPSPVYQPVISQSISQQVPQNIPQSIPQIVTQQIYPQQMLSLPLQHQGSINQNIGSSPVCSSAHYSKLNYNLNIQNINSNNFQTNTKQTQSSRKLMKQPYSPCQDFLSPHRYGNRRQKKNEEIYSPASSVQNSQHNHHRLHSASQNNHNLNHIVNQSNNNIDTLTTNNQNSNNLQHSHNSHHSQNSNNKSENGSVLSFSNNHNSKRMAKSYHSISVNIIKSVSTNNLEWGNGNNNKNNQVITNIQNNSNRNIVVGGNAGENICLSGGNNSNVGSNISQTNIRSSANSNNNNNKYQTKINSAFGNTKVINAPKNLNQTIINVDSNNNNRNISNSQHSSHQITQNSQQIPQNNNNNQQTNQSISSKKLHKAQTFIQNHFLNNYTYNSVKNNQNNFNFNTKNANSMNNSVHLILPKNSSQQNFVTQGVNQNIPQNQTQNMQNMTQSVKYTQAQNNRLIDQNNTNQNNLGCMKKFGQLIKGDKNKDLGPVKFSIKLDKVDDKCEKIDSNPKIQNTQKVKSKSHIFYEAPQYLTNIAISSSITAKKKTTTLSERDGEDFLKVSQPIQPNPSQMLKQPASLNLPSYQFSTQMSMAQFPQQSQQIPYFLQEKVRLPLPSLNLIPRKNIITTIIMFKQAVGILHYCRLIFRFIVTLKKLKVTSGYRNLANLNNSKFLSNPQTLEIISRYLLTVLHQLISNVRSKQILYDGQTYKKKQVQQDKLCQVTQEYYRKYYQDINKSIKQKQQSKNIYPVNDKSTTLEFFKQFCQQMWQGLDRQINLSYKEKQRIQKIVGENIHETNYQKVFTNLCYLSVRFVEANQLLMTCSKSKNYSSISNALIENWITEDYYNEQEYIKAKNQLLAMQNENNSLKFSETNDTEDYNPRTLGESIL